MIIVLVPDEQHYLCWRWQSRSAPMLGYGHAVACADHFVKATKASSVRRTNGAAAVAPKPAFSTIAAMAICGLSAG